MTVELRDISRQAFRMAKSVLEEPALREQMKEDAARLLADLGALGDQLSAADPEFNYGGDSDLLSEGILDLNFVLRSTDIVSLRIGREIRGSTSGKSRT